MTPPAEILTYATTPQPPRWARWLMRPVAWPFLAFLLLLQLLILWEGRLRGAIEPLLLIVFGNGLMLVLWLLRQILRAVLFRVYRHPWRTLLDRWLFTLAAFLLACGTILLVSLEVPEYLAFRISRPAMERLVHRVQAAPSATHPDQWVGLFPVRSISTDGAGKVWFFVRGAGFLDRNGYYYSETPPATLPGSAEAEAVAPPWYRLHEGLF